MDPQLLIDPFGRRVNYLRISVTDRCNLACRYCRPLEELLPKEELLSFEEIFSIAEAGAGLGITKLRVTGGEPLVRKDIVTLVRMLSGVSGIQDISLTTNGVLLKNYAGALKEAGLRRINVSLDTLREERFKSLCGGSLKEVLEGIGEAEHVGLKPIKVNTVLIKGFNDDEVLDFLNLAKERGIRVRFIELMPFGEVHISRSIPALEVIKKLSAGLDLKPIPGDGGVARRYALGRDAEFGVITPMSESFCEDCNRLRLTASGKLRSCLLNDYEVDLLPLLRGNQGRQGLVRGFISAVQMKPRGHNMHRTGFRKCVRSMNSIGG